MSIYRLHIVFYILFYRVNETQVLANFRSKLVLVTHDLRLGEEMVCHREVPCSEIFASQKDSFYINPTTKS